MELSAANTIAFEFAVPALLLLVFALGDALGTGLAKTLMLWLAAVQIAAVVFRPEDYNTDTWAYYNYVELLSEAEGNEVLLLTKFEPLHLVLVLLTRDFRWWLVVENLLGVGLLWTLCRRTERLETIAVVVGLALPLFSSSVRFANGLLAVACALAVFRDARGRTLLTTVVGGATHVSLLLVGVMQRRSWVPIACVLLGFVALALVNEDLRGRAGAGDDAEFAGAGTRSFAGCLLLIGYLRAVAPAYRGKLLRSDLLAACGVYALSMLFFPVLNRWLILLMLVMVVDAEPLLAGATVRRSTGALAAVGLYALLTLPFLFKLASTWGAEALEG
ncbi:MAG: hypothetical protein IT383_10385 [Deltaproteobacteria bacterium]|nr:hypothetical protein [Deltaproteobacteria bacterium]